MSMKYESQIIDRGSDVDSFSEADFLILYGPQAPEELKAYCFIIDVAPIEGTIEAGDIVSFGDQKYTISCVGQEAQELLKTLGHCTIRFNGAKQPQMPGTIYVEKKELPKLEKGMKIQIA